MLFRFEKVSKEFGSQVLFESITAQAGEGDRIGLIGANGCGKTTLLDLIEGRLEPDSGEIHRRGDLKVSRIEQIPHFSPEVSLGEETLKVFSHFRRMESRLEELEATMSRLSGKVPRELASEYESLQTRLELGGGYDYAARTEAVLLGLGFSKPDLAAPCRRLSGGQVSRLLLARCLLKPASLLLLDEPTNHLDLEGLLWLTDYLQEQRKPFVVVSHDRHFLDAVTDLTWEIEEKRVFVYRGSFSRARRQRQQRRQIEEKRFAEQKEWKAKTEEYIRRNIAGQNTKQAQSRRKQLDKAEWLRKPGADPKRPSLRIKEAGRGGALTFSIQGGCFAYPGKTLLENVDLTVRRGDRVALLGKNGSGKSTFIRTLMGEIGLSEGQIKWGANVVVSYFPQNPSIEDGDETVYDRLRRLDLGSTDLELRSFAACFLFTGEDIFKPVGRLSGGELSRLALAELLYHPTNFLILDEPTNHLDIPSREALEAALAEYSGTLVAVSHDLYFLGQVTDQFYLIEDERLKPLSFLDEVDRIRPGPEAARAQKPLRRKTVAKERKVGLSKNEQMRRQRRLSNLEARIEALERAKAQALDAMQTDRGFATLHRLSDRLEELERQLAALYQEWEATAAELGGAT